jgi:hypothetical protein
MTDQQFRKIHDVLSAIMLAAFVSAGGTIVAAAMIFFGQH